MEKLPFAMPTFRQLLDVAVKIVVDPLSQELQPFQGQADSKDLSILAAAIINNCNYLVTFNVRHYYPVSKYPVSKEITILRPGEFLERVRRQLTDVVD